MAEIQIQNVNDTSFKKYGRILTKSYDLDEVLAKMEETPLPDDVIYVPSAPELEALPSVEVLRKSLFGGAALQIGYCNGHNHLLNALEYHRSSEFNIAVTDMILLIGSQQDIEVDYCYHTDKVEAFFVPKGTMIEVYATTLHYAPCGVKGEGFRCVVILPEGTNLPLTERPMGAKEDSLLMAVNKWLIAHKDAMIENAYAGLIGENISVE